MDMFKLWSNMRSELQLQVYGEPIYQQLCKKNLRQSVNRILHGTTRINMGPGCVLTGSEWIKSLISRQLQ
jgi:hypothetical protein